LYLDSPAVDQTEKQDLYRIGTVASLTGLSVERLRAWERRYDLSPAHKAGKTRFYSKPQLDRLKLIKHLIDQGHPISSLVALSHEQLAERIADQPVDPVLVTMHAPKVGLVGPNLVMLEQQAQKTTRQRIEVVSRWANMDAFIAEQSGTDNPQILILQLPVLSLQAIDIAKDLFPKTKIVAVYQFATAEIISKVQQYGAPTLKWPVSWAEIEHTAISESGLPARAGRAVPRRFSDEELIAIAAQSEDPTHCPEYLIEAINQLNAFAVYAGDCAQASADGTSYEDVQTDTTQARSQLEIALESLLSTKQNIATS
jgi:DNA-binding transcriptional MerR regulator